VEGESLGERVSIDVEGGAMEAFICRPASGERHPGIVIVHDIYGLQAHSEDVACRFAAQGYVALVPDLFWQVGSPRDFTDRESFMQFRRSLDDRQILESIDAAAAQLRDEPDVEFSHVGIVGFCMGGYYAFLAAVANPSVAACVDFYGAPVAGLLEPAQELRVPVLGLFGDQDQSIPVEEVRQLEEALQAAGCPYEFHIYPGAGHAFFNDTKPTYRGHAAEDAWRRTLDFFRMWLDIH
jgi:carboxymethylenebutenolidase